MSDIISSKNNPRVKEAFALKGKGGDRFLIEGFHLCQMAFEHHCLEEVFAIDEPPFSNPNTHLVNKEIINKLSLSVTPEPIVGVAVRPKEKPYAMTRALVLDRVQDPGNVGTLLRTALAFGFEDVVFLPGTCSPFNPKAIASSQGAIFNLSLHFPVSEKEAIRVLKNEGYRLVGSALTDNSKPEEGYVFPKDRLALVLGNEGKGMSESLLSSCDDVLKIAISGIDSLNVAIAGGILMHDASK